MLTITDSISRLPRLESYVRDDIGPKSSASTSTSTFSIELDDEPPLCTCLLNDPILADNIQYPLDYNLIHDRQLLEIQGLQRIPNLAAISTGSRFRPQWGPNQQPQTSPPKSPASARPASHDATTPIPAPHHAAHGPAHPPTQPTNHHPHHHAACPWAHHTWGRHQQPALTLIIPFIVF